MRKREARCNLAEWWTIRIDIISRGSRKAEEITNESDILRERICSPGNREKFCARKKAGSCKLPHHVAYAEHLLARAHGMHNHALLRLF